MTEPIVVATDGSRGATAAVEWAADDAARKGSPLRIVHAVDHRLYEVSYYPIPSMQDFMTRSGRQILREAEQIARDRQSGVDVTAEMIDGAPARVLREEATHAAELVVGHRGLGGFAGMLLGSVSMQVAGHVAVPVIVVRPGRMPDYEEIVVGIDGSAECEPALAYAFEEARLRGCGLRAIYAWQVPALADAAGVIIYDMDKAQQAQQRFVMGKLAAWQEKYPEVTVETEAVCAHPVTALAEASKKADLLVVGSRGSGAISAVVLGSVSRAVLHHAHCPVAVVRS
jgi:nucleotide-binding universal stress UspA family protein